MTAVNIYQDLPKVVIVERVEDAGEFGAVHCPHCGAEGRYIYWFTCEDGTSRGAMKGCFGHFPKHPFADRYAQILDKQRANAKKGWNLASWDTDVMSAIERFTKGEIVEWQAKEIIRNADSAKKSYMKRRGYR